MEEQYANLRQYEKTPNIKSRFGAIYRIYLGKLWSTLIKDPKSWIFNSLMILPIVAGPIDALLSRGSLDYSDYFSLYSDVMFMGYFGLIIPLFTMYIATMLFNDEINDRTIAFFTTRPINRFELIIVKYLSYLTIVPLFTAISSGLVYISFGAFGGFRYWDMGLWYFLAAFVAAIIYGALFMFIGLLFKNPLWFGLFFVFIWEFVFASFSQTLNSLTVAYYVKSLIVTDIYPDNILKFSPAIILGNQAHVFSGSSNPAGPVTYSIVMVVVIIVSLTLSWSRLQGDRFTIPYGAGRRPGGWKYYLKEIRSYLITFGILFLTIGLVVGPVSGTTKNTSKSSNGYLNMGQYPYWDGDNPSLNDMGFGSSFSYTLSKDDSITIRYQLEYAPPISYDIYGVVVTEETYTSFIEQTQEMWNQYKQNYFDYIGNISEIPTTLYPTLITEYSIIADDFVEEAVASTNQLYIDIEQSIPYTASKAETIYCMILVTYFETSEYGSFNAEVNFVLSGTMYRRGGYIFGWVLAGLGVTTGCLAIYSLATYSSEDEILRYEEQISRKESQKLEQ
ncbi:MAG TPA: ABC transporter permease [candidate division Zixibacteria bacterium]|nr:ABC transporter permease [candidate division Zixibacteria bacterium]